MRRAEMGQAARPHGRVGQRSALAFLILVFWSTVPGIAQQRGYVQWPMGQEWRGVAVPGHDIESLLNFGFDIGGEVHGGVDFIWSTNPGLEPYPNEGDATFEAPVYAIADGKLICENLGLSSYTDWPGRVIVIEHILNGERFFSLYGHLRYPTGRDPFNNPEEEDPWALPPFGTISGGFRQPGDPAIYVRRGQQVGTVMKWRNDDGTTNLSNSHLHFEIRTRATGAWLGNCQGEGYTESSKPDDNRSVEQWLEDAYYWLNPVNFIYEHGRPTPLALVTDSHISSAEVRTEPGDDRGISLGNLPTERPALAFEREKEGDGDWWYRVLALINNPDRPLLRLKLGWIKAYKSMTDLWPYTRKSEILAAELPQPPKRDSTVVSYSYSFNDLSGMASVPRGENFTIWKAIGGCGSDFLDIALCQVSRDGRVRAYNHDCLSEEGLGTFGPLVSQGCSRAEEFGYAVQCCVEP